MTGIHKELVHFFINGAAVLLFGAWLVHTGISMDAGKGGRIYIAVGFMVMACMAAAFFQFIN